MSGLRLFWILCLGWLGLLAAVVAGGFLYEAVGLWLSILWGLALIALLGVWLQGRRRRSAG
jgi:hypothetical protein